MTLSLWMTNIANDTFAFGPWILGKVAGPALKDIRYQDLETLNKAALSNSGPDLCKISFNTLPRVNDRYVVLEAGSALVRGNGPKIVSKENKIDFSHSKIAIPGKQTTAWLLAQALLPSFKEVIELPYGEILEAVSQGTVDCGLLIHESTFDLEKKGFIQAASLYDLWRHKTNDLPLPLGGIIAKRSLGEEKIKEIFFALSRSIQYAKAHPEEIEDFILEHSPIKDINVIRKGLNFWVNEETQALSSTGKKAIETLVNLKQEEKIRLF